MPTGPLAVRAPAAHWLRAAASAKAQAGRALDGAVLAPKHPRPSVGGMGKHPAWAGMSEP